MPPFVQSGYELNGRGLLLSLFFHHARYDSLGRVTASVQITAGQTYAFGYNYHLAGSLTSEEYPSGRTIATGYDGANRANSVTGLWPGNQRPYASDISYAPHGAIASEWFGNELISSYGFNNRLQPATVNAGTLYDNGMLTLSYGWGSTNNNGNLQSENVTTWGGAWFTDTYSHDTLNRVQSATDTGGWSQSFQYDPYGNMWETTSGVPVVNTRPTSNVYNANNQLTTASYDAAGNQISVPNISGSMSYDAENRMVQAVTGSGTTTYAYDGDGRRVEKMSNGSSTVYVYDALGQLAAEYSTTPTVPACTTCYLSTDNLGSTRMVTDQLGNIVSFHDYLPFGEEVPTGQAGRSSAYGLMDGVNQKFTGKERDLETAFDYFGARYYGSALGRFTSPDPKGIPDEFDNPQAWNKYAYTGNNPLRYTDPDGKDWKDVVAGAFNAFTSDNAFGAGRQSGNSDFQNGQAMGDVVAAGQGTVQMIVGAAGDIGGTLLDLTGVGAVIGVPAQAVSTAVGLDGVGVAGTAAGNLITQASAIGPKQGASEPGSGKDFSNSTKSDAMQENQTANGGQAKCVFCGESVGDGTGNKVNIDHAQAKANGGGNGLNNANVSCEYCNKSKGTGDAPKNPKPCGTGQSCSQ